MIVKYKDINSPPWNEDEDKPYIENMEDAQVWAEETIKDFNNTLRPYEKPRELVSVEHLDDESSKHSWAKTSITTIIDRHGTYDEIECTKCSITGKRHGLTNISRDPEYKAHGYSDCKQAKILLERRRKRREKARAYDKS
jgi:hypothetical protein